MRRRLLASGALAALAAALVVAVLALRGDVAGLVGVFVLILVAAMAGWIAVTRRGAVRVVGVASAIAAVIGIVVVMLAAEDHGLGLGAVVLLVVISTAARRGPPSVTIRRRSGTPRTPARRSVPPAAGC